MNTENVSKQFNISELSYPARANPAENTMSQQNTSYSIVDNDFEDISRDIDERVATIRNKIVNDLIKQRLFEGKQRQIKEYELVKKGRTNTQNRTADFHSGNENGSEDNFEADDDKDAHEIRELSEKLAEIDAMIDFVRRKKDDFDALKTKNESEFKEEIDNYRKKAHDLDAAIQNDLYEKLAEKRRTFESRKHETESHVANAKLKSETVSQLLRFQVRTEKESKVTFLFEEEYYVVLQKRLGTWKITEWEPRNRAYIISLSERKQIEESFQKMDMCSWIVGVRGLLLH